jgi:predicted nucleotidyltransferase
MPGKVEYMLLAGSAARGDFVIGESDLDIIIVVHKDSDVSDVRSSGEEIFRRLDRIHGLQLVQAQQKKIEERITSLFQKPPSDYPLLLVHGPPAPPLKKKGMFNLLDPLHGFSKSLYRSGLKSKKLVYGIRPPAPSVDPPRGSGDPGIVTYDLLSSIATVPLAIFMPGRAYRRSLRAVFFSFEEELSKKGPVPGMAIMALYAKKYPLQVMQSTTYPEKIVFCLGAPAGILMHNIRKRLRPRTRAPGEK